MSNTYAADGLCHNSYPGTFGHECGKPADWLGTKPNGFRSGFCDDCRKHGPEARAFADWQPYPDSSGGHVREPDAEIQIVTNVYVVTLRDLVWSRASLPNPATPDDDSVGALTGRVVKGHEIRHYSQHRKLRAGALLKFNNIPRSALRTGVHYAN